MKKFLMSFLTVLVLFACAKPDDNAGEVNGGKGDNPDVTTGEIRGFAQKGQLIKGSNITAYALGYDLVATGESYPAKISDDMGAFKISGRTSSPFFKLNAQGYYFVENTGEISTAPIYLEALVQNGQLSANLNLLTTLTAPRMKKLMSEGMSFSDAQHQAQGGLMRCLGYADQTCQAFSEMNIAGGSDSDAILLAMSCLLQEGRDTGEIYEMMTDMAAFFETNGTLSEELKSRLFERAGDIDVWSVTEGLVEYYRKRNVEDFKVPPFYTIIDEKYSSGIHLFESSSLIVDSVLPFDCNVDKDGYTQTRIVLCTEEFDVVSQSEWITVEKTHYAADFYKVKITIAANAEDIRTGTVQYRLHRGGNVTVEAEDTYKQMPGFSKLYVKLLSRCQQSFSEGEKVAVNGDEYELQRDEIGYYVNLTEVAEHYRVCYPVASTYKDADGNDVAFTPVQCYGDDYGYAKVICPVSGYPEGVYPFYGAITGIGGGNMRVVLNPCTVGLRLIVDARYESESVKISYDSITLVSDKDIFGVFAFANYLYDEYFNPVYKEPFVIDGIKTSTHKLNEYEPSSDSLSGGEGDIGGRMYSTGLLQIPVQSESFRRFDKQISEMSATVNFTIRTANYAIEQAMTFSLPISDMLMNWEDVMTVKLSHTGIDSWSVTWHLDDM